ncbi:oligosaccharide flippase family protein [uncultured Methanofollis sp.]|uniref:oligosaccharide flippase family protein n=1 Tax=uncultured Methanofollis sp. TaxID=262500 RepID=UPI0026267BF1|nr:oligosaccharide flippase family protein [uncultured Methanofollis sp.]
MSSFVTNVLKLISGSIVAQAVGILLIPIISRLYTPDDFGVFQVFLSIAGILAIISCFSYQLAIMLPKEDRDAANLAALSTVLVVATSTVSGAVLIIFAESIAATLSFPALAGYIGLIPILVFLNGLFFILNYWLSRREKFGTVAGGRVANSLVNKGVQIGAGIGVASPLGLIAGAVTGYLSANLIMLFEVRKDLALFSSVTLTRVKALAFRYRKFPIFTSWSTAANEISRQISPIFLAFFFTPTVVGLYSLAYQVVSLPLSLVGTAVSQVFFQKVSEVRKQTGNIGPIVEEVHRRLVTISIFPMLLLLIIGEELFVFFLGAQWYDAGFYVKLLVPWLFFMFVSSPLTAIFNVLEKQGAGLAFELVLLASRAVTLTIGGMSGDPVIAILLFSLTGALFSAFMNIWLLKLAGLDYVRECYLWCADLLTGVLITTPLIVAKFLSFSIMLLFAIAIAVSLIYYGLAVARDPFLKEWVAEFFQGIKRFISQSSR